MFNSFKPDIHNCIPSVLRNVTSGVIMEKFDTTISCLQTSHFVDFFDFSQTFVSVKSPFSRSPLGTGIWETSPYASKNTLYRFGSPDVPFLGARAFWEPALALLLT